jgi:transposase-like protein
LSKNIIMMDYKEILCAIRTLPAKEQSRLIKELTPKSDSPDYISVRRDKLINKQVGCPHCNSVKYYRYGKDKGSMRFKCKECNRTFTEYSGTWLSGIHKKELVNNYIDLMHQKKSLDKIKKALHINKKTAFDWRHKILSSFEDNKKSTFNGIVESDETFFLQSDKGSKSLTRKSRKRGGGSSKRGISDDQVAVIVTSDRKGIIDLTVATLGRIEKKDIENAIGNRITEGSILCTDGHVSYKGFATDNGISQVVLRADLKQHVKQGVYHIQNVNSLHNQIKKWIDSTFWGVSTKYLQNYLNWYRVQQTFKKSICVIQDIVECSTENMLTLSRYRKINERYMNLITTHI